MAVIVTDLDKPDDCDRLKYLNCHDGEGYHMKSIDGLIEKIEQMDFDFGDYYDHTNEIIDKVVGAIKEYCGGDE